MRDVERNDRDDKAGQARYGEEPGRIAGYLGCDRDARDPDQEHEGSDPAASQELATLRQPILDRIHPPNHSRRREIISKARN